MLKNMGDGNRRNGAMHVAKMAKPVGPTDHDHVHQMLDTTVDVTDSIDGKTVQIDGAIPPYIARSCPPLPRGLEGHVWR